MAFYQRAYGFLNRFLIGSKKVLFWKIEFTSPIEGRVVFDISRPVRAPQGHFHIPNPVYGGFIGLDIEDRRAVLRVETCYL